MQVPRLFLLAITTVAAVNAHEDALGGHGGMKSVEQSYGSRMLKSGKDHGITWDEPTTGFLGGDAELREKPLKIIEMKSKHQEHKKHSKNGHDSRMLESVGGKKRTPLVPSRLDFDDEEGGFFGGDKELNDIPKISHKKFKPTEHKKSSHDSRKLEAKKNKGTLRGSKIYYEEPKTGFFGGDQELMEKPPKIVKLHRKHKKQSENAK